jgi:hypothetical protein
VVLFPHLEPRPVPTSARQALERDLIAFRVDPASAATVARGIVEPRSARAGLKNPSRHRVDGGWLVCLDTYVYTFAALVGTDNPRTAVEYQLPARGGAAATPLPRPTDRPGGGLLLNVPSPDAFVDAVERATQSLVGLDVWNDSISESGVLQPVTLVPVEIHHDDGTPPIHLLQTEDGATRLAVAQSYGDLTSAWDLAYEFTRPGSNRPRTFIADVRRLVAQYTPTTISGSDQARLRSAVIPVRIVLRVEPDPDTSLSLVEALAQYKGQLHIAHAEEWPEGAQRDEQLLEALGALYPRSEIAYRWRSGLLTPTQAAEAGLSPYLDDLGLAILSDLAPHNAAVTQAIRRLKKARKINLNDRIEVAAEGLVRIGRAGLSPRLVQMRRGAVEVLFGKVVELIDAFVGESAGAGLTPWRWSKDEPKRLLERASAELRQSGESGDPKANHLPNSPARIELLARGGLHLALGDGYVSTTRGGDNDRRPIAGLLVKLASTAWGLHILFEALIAGRSGRAPLRVTSNGDPLRDAAGQRSTITEDWIRADVLPRDEDDSANARGRPSTPVTPLERYRVETTALAESLEGTRRAVDALGAIEDASGARLAEDRGITPEAFARRLCEHAEHIQRRLTELRVVGSRHASRFADGRATHLTGPVDDDSSASEDISHDAGDTRSSGEVTTPILWSEP